MFWNNLTLVPDTTAVIFLMGVALQGSQHTAAPSGKEQGTENIHLVFGSGSESFFAEDYWS